MTMLEQENRVLWQRIQAMACVDPLFPCTPPCPLASLSYQPSPSSLHQYDNAGAGEPRTAAAQPGHGECASPTSPLTSTSPLSTLPTHTFPGPSSLLPRPTRLTMLEQENRVLRQRIQAMAMTMLEQENRVLRQRIQAMASVKGPNQLLEQLKNAPRIDVNALRSRGQDMDALARWINEMKEEGGQVERLKKLNKLLQGWYADANSRAEDALQREKEEFIRAKAAEELAAAGDLLILEMEAKFSEMRMKLAA
ncbi:unnamed protein product [Closterium sp. NIES-54]